MVRDNEVTPAIEHKYGNYWKHLVTFSIQTFDLFLSRSSKYSIVVTMKTVYAQFRESQLSRKLSTRFVWATAQGMYIQYLYTRAKENIW